MKENKIITFSEVTKTHLMAGSLNAKYICLLLCDDRAQLLYLSIETWLQSFSSISYHCPLLFCTQKQQSKERNTKKTHTTFYVPNTTDFKRDNVITFIQYFLKTKIILTIRNSNRKQLPSHFNRSPSEDIIPSGCHCQQ